MYKDTFNRLKPNIDHHQNIPARREASAMDNAEQFNTVTFLSRVVSVLASLPQSDLGAGKNTSHFALVFGKSWKGRVCRHSSGAYSRARSRWSVLHLTLAARGPSLYVRI